jgi:phosphonate transport system permease protein
MPPRFRQPSAFAWIVWVVFLAFFLHGLAISGLGPGRLMGGFERLAEFLAQAIPPDPGRIAAVGRATLTTLEMAVVGTAFGALLSLPLALLAARNTSPHPVFYGTTRALVAFLRAVPDLVWGLIFVVAVGLGPGPGILAITVDVMGFCGRFFAERIEEIDPGPAEALKAAGATRTGVIFGAILPASLASFVASTLFSLESAVRSAVVLGLVGAGGIGVELATSMQLLRYDEALMAILAIFAVVVAVERVSAAVRGRML